MLHLSRAGQSGRLMDKVLLLWACLKRSSYENHDFMTDYMNAFTKIYYFQNVFYLQSPLIHTQLCTTGKYVGPSQVSEAAPCLAG